MNQIKHHKLLFFLLFLSFYVNIMGQNEKLEKVTLWYDQEKTQVKTVYFVLKGTSILEGEYMSYNQSGQVSSKGQFHNNESVGEWKYYYEEGGIKMNANLEDSKKGFWTYFYENGHIRMKGTLIKGNKEGKWIFYYESGQQKSEGYYKFAEKQGDWTYFYETGEKQATASYENGTGSYTEFYINGKMKASGTVVDNTSEGLWKYYDNEGRLQSEGYERDGEKNGLWKHFHSNGTLASQGNYLAGNKEQNWSYYYENGILSSKGEYKQGNKENTWKLYHSDGQFKAKADFIKGKGVYEEYYSNENLKVKGQVVDGQNEGKWEYFFEDGKKEGECDFIHGVGIYIGYYPSGDKRIEGAIENGQKIGVWKLYNKKGKVVGFYKTFYDDESQDTVLGDLVPVTEQGDSIVVDTFQQELNEKKKKKKTKKHRNLSFQNPFSHHNHYGQKWFNYHGFIVGANPFGIAAGSLPISLEYFHQQETGYEFTYFYARNPFFTTFENIPEQAIFTTGYALSLKQKFYFQEKKSSMIYLAHEFRFSDLDYAAKSIIEDNVEEKLKAHEYNYAYTFQFGNRILKTSRTKTGITFDIYIGVGIGYRVFQESYLPTIENEQIFESINQKEIFVPTRLGFTFGYLF